MKIIIMAGGEGSRLRPITCGRPKPMVPVVNRPVMLHIVELLKRHNFTDIGVTLQYMPESIRSYFGNGADYQVNMRYFTEETPLGTAGSVKNAQVFLDQTFLVISGDALTDLDLSEAVDFHRRRGAIATLVLTRVNCPLEYGVVITGPDGLITRFLEKPAWGEVFSDTVNTGIYVLEPEALDYIPDGRSFDFSKDLFPILLREKKPLFGVALPGYWCDIGNLQQYVQAHQDVLSGRVRTILPGHETEPGVWLGKGSEIHPRARIQGPALIGDNCCLGAGTQIEPFTTIGDGCLLMENASVKRSVLWNNVYLGAGTALRGAVLCSRVQARANSGVYEGAVVGSDSVLQERSVVKPDIKIWPNKLVETNAVVNSSLVWGSRWPKKIFGLEGITGLFNIEISAEFACRLGAAYCATLGTGAGIAISADSHPPAQVIKEALASGMQSTGAKVYDLDTAITPMHRFAVRSLNLTGGAHVKISHSHPDKISILFTSAKGGNISRALERKMENILAREDFPRVDMIRVQPREFVSGMRDSYLQALLQNVDVPLLREARLRLITSYDPYSLEPFVKSLGQDLNIEIKNLDAAGPVSHPLSWERYLEKLPYLAGRVYEEGAWAGVMLDSNADRLILIDERGRMIQDNMLTVMLALVLLKAKKGPVVVPVTAPHVLENLAREYKSRVVRTKTAVQDLTERILEDKADGIFQFLLNFDALGALTGILGFAVKNGFSLGDLVDEIPQFFISKKDVPVSWENKGRVIRHLIEAEDDTELLDGVKIFHSNGWALVLPDPEEPVCRVFSEGASMEIAESLADLYIKKIGEIIEQH